MSTTWYELLYGIVKCVRAVYCVETEKRQQNIYTRLLYGVLVETFVFNDIRLCGWMRSESY